MIPFRGRDEALISFHNLPTHQILIKFFCVSHIPIPIRPMPRLVELLSPKLIVLLLVVVVVVELLLLPIPRPPIILFPLLLPLCVPFFPIPRVVVPTVAFLLIIIIIPWRRVPFFGPIPPVLFPCLIMCPTIASAR